MKSMIVSLSLVFLCAQAFGLDVNGVVQPAHVGHIVPPCTQSTFVDTDIKVKVGDIVAKGQELIVISETEGGIKSCRLAVEQAKEELKSSEIARCYAGKAMEKAQALKPKNAISVTDYDNCEGAFEKAKQDVIVCQKKLASAEWALVMSTCPINAPISGMIVSLSVCPGDSAGPGRGHTVWGEIIDTSVVDVACKISEENVRLYGVELGRKVIVTCDKIPFEGQVVFVSPILDDKECHPILVRVQNKKGKICINKKVQVLISN